MVTNKKPQSTSRKESKQGTKKKRAGKAKKSRPQDTRIATRAVLRRFYLMPDLAYARQPLPRLPKAKIKEIPGVLQCQPGDRLEIRYDVDAIVAEMELNWGEDVDQNGEWDGLITLGHAESASTVTGSADVTAAWSILLWKFTPANLGPWSAQLSIRVNEAPAMVFAEVSGDQSATHQGVLLVSTNANA
jgi:hypothetical protein